MKDKKLNWTYGEDYFSHNSDTIDSIFDQADQDAGAEDTREDIVEDIPEETTGDTAGDAAEGAVESPEEQQLTTAMSISLLGDEADYYETLHNNLILPFRDRNWVPKTIALTSGRNREGVSSITSKLAISLANHIEGRVLLVDTNFENPALQKVFRVPVSPGFGDVLIGNTDLNHALHRTVVPNLHILPTGELGYNPTPKYDSPKFGDLMKEMENKYTFTIFDCPSFERDPNAAARLSSMVDGLILVVEAEETKWQVLDRIKNRLEKANANILGVVLNKRKFYVPKWIYRRL